MTLHSSRQIEATMSKVRSKVRKGKEEQDEDASIKKKGLLCCVPEDIGGMILNEVLNGNFTDTNVLDFVHSFIYVWGYIGNIRKINPPAGFATVMKNVIKIF